VKGSKLKPDAPEFVPLTLKADERTPSKIDAKNAAKEQKKREKLEKEQQKQQRKVGPSQGKRPGKPLGRHDGADGMFNETKQNRSLTPLRGHGFCCERSPIC